MNGSTSLHVSDPWQLSEMQKIGNMEKRSIEKGRIEHEQRTKDLGSEPRLPRVHAASSQSTIYPHARRKGLEAG